MILCRGRTVAQAWGCYALTGANMAVRYFASAPEPEGIAGRKDMDRMNVNVCTYCFNMQVQHQSALQRVVYGLAFNANEMHFSRATSRREEK